MTKKILHFGLVIMILLAWSTTSKCEEKYGCWLTGRVFTCPKYPQYEWVYYDEYGNVIGREPITTSKDKVVYDVDENDNVKEAFDMSKNPQLTQKYKYCISQWSVYVLCSQFDNEASLAGALSIIKDSETMQVCIDAFHNKKNTDKLMSEKRTFIMNCLKK